MPPANSSSSAIWKLYATPKPSPVIWLRWQRRTGWFTPRPLWAVRNTCWSIWDAYTHRVAISSRRLLALQDGQVSFQWKDYRDGQQQKGMTVSAEGIRSEERPV